MADMTFELPQTQVTELCLPPGGAVGSEDVHNLRGGTTMGDTHVGCMVTIAPNVGGNAWSGIGPVFRSSALRNIALWILLMTFASTILYFVQALEISIRLR